MVAQPHSSHVTVVVMTNAEDNFRGPGVAGLAGLIGVTAAILAAAAIWLVLTEPVTVANAVDTREFVPLMRQLAEVIFTAMAGLIDYL
jgi:hypothetical protein